MFDIVLDLIVQVIPVIALFVVVFVFAGLVSGWLK